MNPQEADLRPMHPSDVLAWISILASQPKYHYLRQMTTTDLKKAFEELNAEVTSRFLAHEKQGHLNALKNTIFKFLSKTGWGYFGKKEYLFKFPAKISLEGTSTIDEATPILKMPKETLVQIFDYIDPEEDWGRVAMALTCKKFAVVSKLTKVIKTAVNTSKGKLDLIPSGKKFCSGCGHVRSLSRGFWEINGRLLEAQWDTLPLGETHIPWKPRYDHMIKSWKEGHNNVASRYLDQACWDPACQSQQRWEAWQSSILNDKSESFQDGFMKLQAMQKNLNDRGVEAAWGIER